MLEFKAVECLLSAYVSCDTTICPTTHTFTINTTQYGRIPATLKDGILTLAIEPNSDVMVASLDDLWVWLKDNAPTFN